MDDSRGSSHRASVAQTGMGCHGNRGSSKGQNLKYKPGQNEMVSEATAGAKEAYTGAWQTDFLTALAVAQLVPVPAGCTQELAASGEPYGPFHSSGK